MAYDLEEQEQIATLKAWWKQYGNLVVLALLAVSLAFAAFEGWRYWQRTQAAGAAAVYGEVQRALRANDPKRVRDLAGTLIDKYPRTVYASLAALLSAKAAFTSGDAKTARVQLQWVVDNAKDREIEAVARVRLATVLLDEKAYDDALKVLAAVPAGGSFDGIVAAVKGDILAAKGATAEARAAYKAALDKTERSDPGAREALQIKLDALGAG
ncbi:MAG: tetratricopeptide repeat protein [Burkholderiales bacterium]|jgi:predicted negative regulator of RcsB-dependent stress response|nr:tetratricopeptide repeat protein [Burkholderiales bacterium]